MDKTELLNKTFLYLHTMEDPYTFPSAFEKILNTTGAYSVMLLDTIHEIGFAGKEKNLQQRSSQPIYNYWINAKGIQFIESISDDTFKDKPYSYYLKLLTDEKAIKADREETDHKLKQVTLRNISLHKYVSLLSLVVAIVAIVTPVYIDYRNKNEVRKTELISPDLNRIEQTLQQELQVLEDVLDSLRRN